MARATSTLFPHQVNLTVTEAQFEILKRIAEGANLTRQDVLRALITDAKTSTIEIKR
jgi:hypothetical protein